MSSEGRTYHVEIECHGCGSVRHYTGVTEGQMEALRRGDAPCSRCPIPRETMREKMAEVRSIGGLRPVCGGVGETRALGGVHVKSQLRDSIMCLTLAIAVSWIAIVIKRAIEGN